MQTLLHFIRTRVTEAIVITIVASLSFLVVGKLFARVVLKHLQSLSRVIVWVSSQQIHCRHDFLAQTATGKVSTALVCGLH